MLPLRLGRSRWPAAALLAGCALVFAPAAVSSAVPDHGAILRLGVKQIAPTANTKTLLALRSNSSEGAVSPQPQVYLVFWGSQWATTGDPDDAAGQLQTFFRNLYGAKDTWGTTLDQYCEGLPAKTTSCTAPGVFIVHPTSTPLAGIWFDSGSPAPDKATAGQIGGEAAAAAAHFGNTTQTPNLDAQYVIASPSGTHPDGFPKGNFCGWHSRVPTAYGTLAFTNLPYVPDLGAGACTTMNHPQILDGYFSTETHEYAETVTDFWPDSGWLSKGGEELADVCESLDSYLTLAGQKFDVQGLWSNNARACVTDGS
jgi:hypothetical protein